MGTNALIYKTERFTDVANKFMVMREELGKGVNWDLGTDIDTLPCINR